MERKTSSDRLAEALGRTRKQWEKSLAVEAGPSAPRRPAPLAYTIALSREAGANGRLVARAIGERLVWPVYDRELVEMIAEGMGVRTGLLEGMDEKQANWLRECVEAFASVPSVSHSAYVRHLVETMVTLAARGECVIVGRGAPHVLPPATTLRVRLVGNLPDRVDVIQARRNLSPDDAARWVDKVDRERAGFVRDHFQADPADPKNYDLVLNTSRFSVAECAELVIAALQRLRERKVAPQPAAGSTAMQVV